MTVASGLAAALGLAIAIGALLSSFLRPKSDPREPPVYHPTIPLIGHIIGMLREGPLYYKKIADKCKHELFTLPMLTGRTYICTSPALATLLQRSSTTLSFDQLIVEVTPRMTGLSAAAKELLQDPNAEAEGRVRLVSRAHEVINPTLTLGKMDSIAAVQLRHFSEFVNRMGSRGTANGTEVELFHFVTREITAASMETFYGPENPYAMDSSLISGFWDWEAGVVAYMTGVFPKITARKAYLGLEKGVAGFREYMEKGRYKQAYKLVQDRKALHDAYGLGIEDQARLEMGLSFAFNSNASMTTFWVLNNIYSRPALLAEVREEIRANALVSDNAISYSQLRDKCKLLNSIYRESMRLTAPMTSARFVLADTILADKYLLRKNTVVQIAGGILHSDTAIWGPDASDFNPRRFLYSPNGTKSSGPDGAISDNKKDQVHAAAFRAFGGGTSLCPGRHFAQMEVISLAALIVWSFDALAPAGKESVAWDPPRDDKRFPFAVTKPLRALNVRLKSRPGMEGGKWGLVV